MTKVTKKAVKKTAKTVDVETRKVTTLLRKGALAYVGLYGAAFERAKLRTTQIRQATDGLFDTLVERGTEIEAVAGTALKDVQAKAVQTYTTGAEKVRDVIPTSANDRVQELEAEVAVLNKKLTALAKKASKPVRKVKMTTEKTVETKPVTEQKAA